MLRATARLTPSRYTSRLTPSRYVPFVSFVSSVLNTSREQQTSPSRHDFAIASAERSVSATKVSVPFVQPPVGIVGAPTTKRFS